MSAGCSGWHLTGTAALLDSGRSCYRGIDNASKSCVHNGFTGLSVVAELVVKSVSSFNRAILGYVNFIFDVLCSKLVASIHPQVWP